MGASVGGFGVGFVSCASAGLVLSALCWVILGAFERIPPRKDSFPERGTSAVEAALIAIDALARDEPESKEVQPRLRQLSVVQPVEAEEAALRLWAEGSIGDAILPLFGHLSSQGRGRALALLLRTAWHGGKKSAEAAALELARADVDGRLAPVIRELALAGNAAAIEALARDPGPDTVGVLRQLLRMDSADFRWDEAAYAAAIALQHVMDLDAPEGPERVAGVLLDPETSDESAERAFASLRRRWPDRFQDICRRIVRTANLGDRPARPVEAAAADLLRSLGERPVAAWTEELRHHGYGAFRQTLSVDMIGHIFTFP